MLPDLWSVGYLLDMIIKFTLCIDIYFIPLVLNILLGAEELEAAE